ncbi:MAG TPA: zinc ABC transporter substrate-binding protein, partial [Deltaproteobacteria bacterium]|nr:zinc ABC transporter substrate-binding protein [Deltaproteobacteria bacterium]
HPAFGYFAQSYGLEQLAVEVEGKEPSARQLSDLIARARAEKVRIIFVQPQFSKKNAQTIAQAIGGAVVPINPLPEDYLRELEGMAEKIRDALSRNET